MRYREALIIIIAATAFIVPSVLSAQALRNAKESLSNERQIAVDKVQLARDQKETEEFETLLAEMDALSLPEAIDDFRKLNARLRLAMQREYGQASGKVVRTDREVRESRREAAAERREARRTGDVRDRMQARDDRRDLRDDRRDRASAESRAARMGAIIEETGRLRAVVNDGDVQAISQNRELMGEFLQLLRSDLEADRTELREDRRERREDRRERRTDRNK